MKVAVIFGGTGFIGAAFCKFLLNECSFKKVYLIDHENIKSKDSTYRLKFLEELNEVEFINADVRRGLDFFNPIETIDLVANFAAIHREPGHSPYEYYETNILGAENVCKWAEKINCNKIIFTSSISPYGPSEEIRDESSLPVPTTPYGGSKLAAEKIHQTWQAYDSDNRQLVIVRPGVVFGAGEGGNVTRLIKAVKGRYFVYTGNKKTRKAGVYVKELCNAIYWVLISNKSKDDKVTIFNMSMNPGPSVEDYVNTIALVLKKKYFIPSLPSGVILFLSYIIEFIAKIFNINHPFSPVRIRKLIRSNNIMPTYLLKNNYTYKYTLEEALADWKKDCPEEWS
jgi:nucleoside-diphosphate-sugar epimerase